MKIKTVIVLKSRHNAIQYHSKTKLAKNGNIFTFGNGDYSTDSGHFIITSRWLGVIKRSYITFYFREGHIKALPFPLFEEMEDNGIKSDELNKIFTPKFYQIIARKPSTKKQDMVYYFTIGCLVLSGYTAYMVYQKLPEILALLHQIAGS
jgi:hypothetical protein